MVGSPKKRARREAARNLPMVIPQPAPEREPEDRWGKPWGKYRPEFVEQARTLCEEGITDKELAKFFGIHRGTIYDWQFAHPEFADALKLGREPANDRLERRAYEVAMGYTTTITETIKLKDNQGNEILHTYEKEIVIPPNPDMLRWLLKNRKSDTWRDKTELAASTEVILLTPEQARERLKGLILNLLSKPAGSPEQAAG